MVFIQSERIEDKGQSIKPDKNRKPDKIENIVHISDKIAGSTKCPPHLPTTMACTPPCNPPIKATNAGVFYRTFNLQKVWKNWKESEKWPCSPGRAVVSPCSSWNRIPSICAKRTPKNIGSTPEVTCLLPIVHEQRHREKNTIDPIPRPPHLQHKILRFTAIPTPSTVTLNLEHCLRITPKENPTHCRPLCLVCLQKDQQLHRKRICMLHPRWCCCDPPHLVAINSIDLMHPPNPTIAVYQRCCR